MKYTKILVEPIFLNQFVFFQKNKGCQKGGEIKIKMSSKETRPPNTPVKMVIQTFPSKLKSKKVIVVKLNGSGCQSLFAQSLVPIPR